MEWPDFNKKMSWQPPEATEDWKPPEAASSPTGLSKLAPMIDAGIDAIPGAGAVKQVMEMRPLRKFIGEGAATTGGAAVATAVAGPEMAPIGAGIVNVVGGEISDIADHPERATQVFNLLFNPTTPQVGQQLVQNYQKNPEGTIRVIKEELTKDGIRFTSGAISQLLTMGASKLLSGMAASAADNAPGIIEGAKEGIEARGMQADPSMFTKSRIASVLKSIMNKTQGGQDLIENNEVALQGYTKDLTTDMAGGLREHIPPSELAKSIVAPKQELGEALQHEIEHTKYSALDDLANSRTTAVGADAPNGTITDPVTGKANGTFVSTSPLKDAAKSMSFVDQAGPAGRLIQKVQDQGRFISFQDMHAVRSDLFQLAQSENPQIAGPAKLLVQAADNAMEGAAKSAGEDVYSAWRDANAFTKAGKQTFSNDITAKWLLNEDTAAEKLGARLVNNGTVTQVKQLKAVAQRVEDLVSNPDNAVELQKVLANNPEAQKLVDSGEYTAEAVMNKYRRGVLQNLFSRYQQPSPDSLVGSKTNYLGMLGEFDHEFNPEGAEVYKELWSAPKLQDLKDTMTSGYRAIQKNPTAFDRAMMWGGRILSGAVGSAAGSMIGHPGLGAMGAEATYLLGEGKVASYLLTDPKASKLFTQGIKALADTNGAKIGTNLIVQAARTFADNQLTSKEAQ